MNGIIITSMEVNAAWSRQGLILVHQLVNCDSPIHDAKTLKERLNHMVGKLLQEKVPLSYMLPPKYKSWLHK